MIGGWNMVSLPLTVADRRKTTVFPTSSSDAFTYTPSGYTARDTLRYGEGYWLKFPSAQTVSIVGEARDRDTIDVVSGWNMIGSISGPVPTDSIIQIPSAIVISPYFGGTPTGYVVEDTVHSMRGYWVKVSQNGQLILVDPAGSGPAGSPKGNR
jgi:hypothetical protein